MENEAPTKETTMASFCYLCATQASPLNRQVDTCWICTNCGGATCDDHGGRDGVGKNCWCDDCVAKIAALAARQVAIGLNQMTRRGEPIQVLREARRVLLSDTRIVEFTGGDLEVLASVLRRVADRLDEAVRSVQT